MMSKLITRLKNLDKFQTLHSSEDLKTIQETYPNALLVDVRELSEWNSGHMKNALHIPLAKFSVRALTELPDKNQCIVVYCASGVRSRAACKVLTSKGYKNVFNLTQGY